ncbi:hypothetical protein [Streptomyces jumonjinensis]|uniref:Uncharacterized protein n=1 Tax=Streptomyces jumonjinensis TaxID=1945 RepID=A0A646KA08_STRJU|nr:hypothetical protein [Streptomyces jumonjinensis]MQS98929.1 hypothetical protein [Streptomyces jumonjinensis]
MTGSVGGTGSTDPTFSLDIPASWTRYDLSGEKLGLTRARLLSTASAEHEHERIDEAFRGAHRILDGAGERGALYAAGTSARFKDGLLMAGLMVFQVVPRPGERASPRAVARRFSATGRRRDSGSSGTFTTVALPSIGPVGRLVGVEESDLVPGVRCELLVMHTVVPVPGSSRVLIITCFSPNIPLSEPLYDMFGAITSTFSFTGEQASPQGVRNSAQS